MLNTFFESLFGCSHHKTTFPITRGRKSPVAHANGTYVVCLDCGKEFAYDWKSMRVGELVEAPVTSATPALYQSPSYPLDSKIV